VLRSSLGSNSLERSITLKPILSLDTSGVNALLRDGGTSAPLFAGLVAGYSVRMSATVIDEIIANSSVEVREQLRRICRNFLLNDGDIVLPFHEITRKLARQFDRDSKVDFSRLDVRSEDYEDFIRQGDVSGYEVLFAEQRQSAQVVSSQFERVFNRVRAKYQKAFVEIGERPESAAQLEEIFKKPGGHYWGLAANLYERAIDKRVDENTIRKFIDACPPFKALMSALTVGLFDRCVPAEIDDTRAGRNDLFMSVYLPYCEQFISNDHSQQKALRQVVSLAGLETKVRWYREFSRSLSVGGAGRARGNHGRTKSKTKKARRSA
jgi:hypothetical protein